MSPEAFEAALIAQIALLNIPALPYPEAPKNYYPENDPGEVLVRYEGRKILERDIAGLTNRVKLFAEVVVISREVRGENGAYNWLHQIYKALEGFTLDGAASPLTHEVESFMDENDGLWQYGQKWSAETYEFIEITDDYVSPVGNN
jgi:hypothetical protein